MVGVQKGDNIEEMRGLREVGQDEIEWKQSEIKGKLKLKNSSCMGV